MKFPTNATHDSGSWTVTADESEEEKIKRAETEQAKADRENGKLEYYAAIAEEGLPFYLLCCL